MQCVTPMVRWYNKEQQEIKKLDPESTITQRIIPRSEVFANLQQNENWLTHIQNLNYDLEKKGSPFRYQLIPCRHCWSCQLKYAAQWATRIMCETKRHTHNYFITLTYDDEHLPIMDKIVYRDKIYGDLHEVENDGTWIDGCLEPKDVNRFLNTLRKHYERLGIQDIKYFYCGEYGTENGRPHYHMILMGAPLDIDKFYSLKFDSKNFLHWKSPLLEKWWGKGFVDVAEVEWGNASYVARYCMKKISNENDPEEYAKIGKIKEFVRMSRRPSIGKIYWEENKEHLCDCDEIIQKNVKGKITPMPIPDAWMKLLKDQNPEMYEKIKLSRKQKAERTRIAKLELQEGISDLERLNQEAQKVLKKGNMLTREL